MYFNRGLGKTLQVRAVNMTGVFAIDNVSDDYTHLDTAKHVDVLIYDSVLTIMQSRIHLQVRARLLGKFLSSALLPSLT